MSFFSTPTAEDNLKIEAFFIRYKQNIFLTLYVYEWYFMKAYVEWKLWDITICVWNLCDSTTFVLNVIFYVLSFLHNNNVHTTKYATFANGNFNKL